MKPSVHHLNRKKAITESLKRLKDNLSAEANSMLSHFKETNTKLSSDMGCVGSSHNKTEGSVKKLRKPKAWKHPQPITKSQLIQLREEFWDTAPHYGGRKEIWDALRAAAEEADTTLAQATLDSAGIIVHNADLTVCYDERGARYELPKYVLSDPKNLIEDR